MDSFVIYYRDALQLYKSAKDDYLDDRRDEEPKHVCK